MYSRTGVQTCALPILGFSRLMTMADNAADEKLYSDIINQNSEILLQLINDILDLAKIEIGRASCRERV